MKQKSKLFWNQSQADKNYANSSVADYSPHNHLSSNSIPVQSEIASYLPLFPIMEGQLKGTVTQIEEAVVEVCGSFQGISERARESVSKSAEFLDNQGTDRAEKESVETLIKQCRNTMENLLVSVQQTEEVSHKAVEQMKAIDGYAKEVSAALKLLHGIAEGNKILAINARIEAAHAGVHGTGFSVVADEVNVQAQRSCEVIDKIGGLAGNLRTKAYSAVADLEKLSSESNKNAEASKQEVSEALNAFGRIHTRMETVLSAMTEDSQLLAGEVSTAIRGLQFQDRTSQRISHVIEALDTLHRKFSELCEGYEPADRDKQEEFFQLYTMREEWQTAGVKQDFTPGEVELF
jgi:methyl-accepting chemotaxis protein